MNLQEHLLTCMAEECVETAQRITKALRFGLHEVQPGQALSNLERINVELTDLLGVASLLCDHGVDIDPDPDAFVFKKAKVMKFAAYAREQGALS
jgi:NTP pyrophosphatase (non-canonical NTP hydrolase)